MNPTISLSVKAKLSTSHYNNGYSMLHRCREICEPAEENQYMWLLKEYFSLNYRLFPSALSFFDYFKRLEESISVT